MTELARTDAVDVAVTETSWQPQAPMTYTQWAHAGQQLQRIARSVNWLLGDWLAYGEHHYGDTYTQAIEQTGLETQSLMNIASVARRVPPASRRRELSWSHHEAVAALTPADQAVWLDRAQQEHMTVKRLRKRLNGTPADAPDPDAQLTPTHIARLTVKFVAESDAAAHDRVRQLAGLLNRQGVTVTHKTTRQLT